MSFMCEVVMRNNVIMPLICSMVVKLSSEANFFILIAYVRSWYVLIEVALHEYSGYQQFFY